MKNSYRLQLIIIGIISILMGAVFIIFPSESLKFISLIIVILLFVFGLIQFIGYFITSVKDNQFRIGFVVGLFCFILAAFVYFKAETFLNAIPKILGIAVIIDSAITLQNAIDLLRLKSNRWWYQLVIATITVILGIILFFNPFNNYDNLILFAGITMIVNGAFDLFNILYLSRKITVYERAIYQKLLKKMQMMTQA